MERDGIFIGELSKRTGIRINTIRFYEHQGLLDPPRRTVSGYRLYEPETLEKLLFIKKAQRFGLTLGEIRTVIQNSKKGIGPCCDHVRKLIDKKVAEFDQTIKELHEMKRGLRTLIQKWMPVQEAKRQHYVVCPQIETDRQRRKGGKENVEKKR